MAKIKFTSKRGAKPSKLESAAGSQRSSMIYYQGEPIGSVTGASEICLYCNPKNVILRIKGAITHREAVNYVKAHAQELWDKYDFRLKLELKK